MTPPERGAGAATARPWWLLPIFGPIPPGVEPQHLRLLGFVAVAMFFEYYDLSLLGAVLKYLSEDFGLSKADLGTFTGSIRLGALPALMLLPLADRIGRRPLFLISIVGMTAGTVLTAFSQTPMQFIACQIISRTFILAAASLAFLIITEEFPAAHRGWGIGLLAAMGSVGYGAGVFVFAFIEWLPFGWRFLYALSAVALLALPALRSGIPETARFRDQLASRTAATNPVREIFEPVLALARMQPRHATAVVLLGIGATAATATAVQLNGEFILNHRGWAPWQFSAMYIVCGSIGILGSPWVGRLGDDHGRRWVGAVLLCAFPVATAILYMGPGPIVPLAWIGMTVITVSASTVIRSLTNETFPTSRRGSAGGLLTLTEAIGAAGGLFLYTLFMHWIGDQALVTTLISLGVVIGLISLPLFPETRKLELEAISGEEE